ncbi:hypothetical protein DRJ16_03520 [Candidatus Woesearchaeota archaeon]|nr:MAG: hypothetical protein DRJ16_03520 [Candidatus Woesearchaeota archaeon]
MTLDLKDKKLLFELDKNSRATLTQLAKKLKTSKEVVHYRLNQLIENKIILRFHTVPASYRFGLSIYKVYLRFHDVSKKKFDELVNYLLKNKDIFWVGVTKGRWDLMFGVWAKNIEEFFSIHDVVLDKFSKYIQDKELSISRENIQYNRRWLYDDKSEIAEFNFGEKEDKTDLDEIDKKILDVLANNSREKIIDISEKTKLSVDSVSYRIKKMQKEDIIRGYKCLWNASKLGFTTCKAFVFFKNITEGRKKEFIDYCKGIDNSVNIVITFAPWDLEIMFETKDYESYFEIMDKVKDKFNDVVKYYDSVLITGEPKQVFVK